MRSWIRMILIVGVSLTMPTGCGDDDDNGNGTDPTPQPIDVSGFVVKGPVSDADVEVRAINPNGTPGALIAGPVPTATDGSWSVTVPDGANREFLIVASGGSYVDEATQATVDLTSAQQLISYLPTATQTEAIVTPLTHAMYFGSLYTSGGLTGESGQSPTMAWGDRRNAFMALGFDPLTTRPDASGTEAEQRHAALLAGASAIVDRDNIGSNPFDGVLALAHDAGDGRLDGADSAGGPIVIGAGMDQLGALDAGGVGEWIEVAESVSGVTWDEDPVLPPPPPPSGCESSILLARAALENALFAEINDVDPESPDDLDFDEPKQLYEAALTCDPNSPEANLALAILEIATLTTDPEVNAAFDEWDAYLDAFVPFETSAPILDRSGPLGMPTGDGVFAVPINTVRRSLMSPLRAGLSGTVPQVSRVQAILEERVIPRAARAAELMDVVLEDADYEFTITPRMQGDMLEEPLRADYTDFLVVRGVLNGVLAASRAAISYEVSMDEYDEANILSALDQDSGTWLKLRSGGAGHMAMIPGELLQAANDLDAAIDALFAEIDGGDSQDDEIIKIGPDLPSRAEIQEFQNDELPRIIRALEGPTTETYDWDFTPSTPPVALTVDFHGFFTNPVADFKALAPPYDLTTESIPYETDDFNDQSVELVEVTVPQAGFYGAFCQVNYNDFELSYQDCFTEPWLEAAILAVIDAEVGDITSMPDWGGELSVYVQFNEELSAGTQLIELDVQVYYDVATRWVAIPIVTFEADTFAEWAASWPDPTMGGLFPDATSSAAMVEIFGMDEDDWGKVLRLDWADGFEIEDGPLPAPTAGR